VLSVGRAALALLAIAFACIGPTACSDSSTADNRPKGPSSYEVEIFKKQRAEALALVSCARRHGIDLPAPTAKNSVSTRGVNLKSPRRKAELSNCYRQIVKKAAKEQKEEQEAQEAAPRRLGEEPTSPGGAKGNAFAQERQHLVEIVACARKHGVHLPEPDSHNNIKPGRVGKTAHGRAVLNTCVRSVVGHVTGSEPPAQESGNGPPPAG
jgi:hypothetical protein